jgi:hypothetical protein
MRSVSIILTTATILSYLSVENVANTVMKSVGAGETVTDIGILDKEAVIFLYGDTTAFNFDALTIAHDTINNEIDITGTASADKFREIARLTLMEAMATIRSSATLPMMKSMAASAMTPWMASVS